MQCADIAYALRVFRAGVLVSYGIALASVVYLLGTFDGQNRGWLLGLTALLAAIPLAVSLLPQRRLAESGRATLLLGVWNAMYVVGIAAAAMLDGVDSPYVGLFWVSVTFAAVGLPRRSVAALTALNATAIALIPLAQTSLSEFDVWPLALRVAALAAAATVCSTLAADRRRQLLTLLHHNSEVVRRLALVVEQRDNDTGGHVERIGSYSALIAAELGIGGQAGERLRLAATLHDVGKVGIADAILLKPGPLTDAERTEMQRHAEIGFHMLAGSGIDVLDAAAEIARTHHEHFDGAGYPHGLAGEAIPLPGRIVAVADVFDALTSDRVYKAAMDFDVAVGIIGRGAGSQFDPAVVAAFLRRLDDVRAIHADFRTPAEPVGPALVAA